MAGIWAYGADIDYGLRFKSNTISTTTESSFILYEGKGLRTGGKDFSIEFDMRNPHMMQFGSVLRIAAENCEPIDLMYYVNTRSQFVLGANFKEKVVDFTSPIANIGKWCHLTITISPLKNKIEISYGNEIRSLEDVQIREMDRFRCIFGSVKKFGAGPDQVANVDIRDIIVKKDGKLLNHWKLMAHGEDFCLDEISNKKAVETSCEWLVDRYTNWDKEFSINRPAFVGADMGEGKLWICMRDRIERYDCINKTFDTLIVTRGHPASYAGYQMKYISGKLVSYNLEDGSISSFDIKTGAWSRDEEFSKDYCHYSNTTVVDTLNNRLISFGGYGLYQFSDDISVLNYKTGEFKQIDLPEVSYRFRPCSAIVDGKFYIHGGYGTFNGHQGFTVRYYNDLCMVDPETFEVVYIWEGEEIQEGYLPSENMIWDETEKCFYIVREKTGFVIEKMTLDTPDIKKLSQPYKGEIPETAKHPNNIFRSKETGKIYCLAETTNENGNTSITLLSMLWPPMDAEQLMQNESDSNGLLLMIICLFGISAGCFAVYKLRKKNQLRKSQIQFLSDQSIPAYDFSKSSISFLGGFKVIDKNGDDMTSSFTPTLKSILVLTILSAPKGGISTSRFDRIIWPYKPVDTTNNNRNVYMSRIRPLLEKIGGIHIISKNKTLSVVIQEDVICDYLEIMRLLREERNNENLKRITELFLRGSLLPNMEDSWTEPFKKDLSSQIVEILSYQLRRSDLPADTKLSISDLILKYDYLNEDAIKCKCKILTSQGKTGFAKEVYDNFYSEYREVMGIEYHLPFTEFFKKPID